MGDFFPPIYMKTLSIAVYQDSKRQLSLVSKLWILKDTGSLQESCTIIGTCSSLVLRRSSAWRFLTWGQQTNCLDYTPSLLLYDLSHEG